MFTIDDYLILSIIGTLALIGGFAIALVVDKLMKRLGISYGRNNKSMKMKKYIVTYKIFGTTYNRILEGKNISEINAYCAMYINGDIISIVEYKEDEN